MPAACVVHTPLGPWPVDCGDGTLWQLLRAGIAPQSVQHLVFTHLHTDHTLGYAPFVAGRRQLGTNSVAADLKFADWHGIVGKTHTVR